MTTWNVSKHIATSLREHDFYPFRWERKAFEHWYIPAFGPYLVAKLLAIPLYTSGESFSFLDIDEDIIFLSSVLTVSIMALLYLAWQKRIPFVFLKLKNHLIKAQQGNSLKKKYDEFLGNYLKELHSPIRYLLVLTFISLLFLFWPDVIELPTDTTHVQQRLPSEPPFFFIFTYYVMFYIVSPLVWTYYAAIALWVMVITGRYLWKLPKEFQIKVEPRHPDRCGGLSFLGVFCLGFSYPMFVGTLYMAIVALTKGILVTSVADGVSAGATFALVFVAMPYLYVSFFVPLWGLHKEMEIHRTEYLETGAFYIKHLEAKVDESIQNHEFATAKALSAELDSLISYYSGDIPVWPFDRNIFLKFLSPQIVPVLGILLNLGDLTQKNLSSILQLLRP